MSKFPPAIDLPPEIDRARARRLKHLLFSTLIAISFRLIIVIAEMVGVYYSESNTLWVDAIFNLVDITFSCLLILSIKLATKPPDKEHPFGHGRYEPLMGLQSALFLSLVGVGLFIQQLISRESHQNLDQPIWLIPLLAVFLLEISHALLMRAAKKEHSPALKAEAWHYRIDSLTSLFAVITLFAADYFPSWASGIDRGGALVIALLMVIFGIFSYRGNVQQLMDRAPDQDYFEKVKAAVMKVSGVLDVEKTRIQLYGPDAHVDIDIEVDPSLSVEVAHRISQNARAAIQKAWPPVRDVTVHVEPFYPGDH